MADATLALAIPYSWLIAAALGIPLAAALWRWSRLRRMNGQFQTALNNMSAGLCMWSPSGHLILCNERYVQMYNLTPEVTRPGISLRELLLHRIRMGNFSGDPDQYIADVLATIAKGKTVSSVREHEGRFIALANRPMPGGGWVATHEDVTEQTQAEMSRTSMLAAESRRAEIEQAVAGFRARVENVLKTVSDSAGAMQSTAGGLLKASEKTSQRAESAVRSSNEASTNVAVAATAAAELSGPCSRYRRMSGDGRSKADRISRALAFIAPLDDDWRRRRVVRRSGPRQCRRAAPVRYFRRRSSHIPIGRRRCPRLIPPSHRAARCRR